MSTIHLESKERKSHYCTPRLQSAGNRGCLGLTFLPTFSSCILPCSGKVLPYAGFRVKGEDRKKGEEMDGREREAGGES